MTEEELENLHKKSFKNMDFIGTKNTVGCFACEMIFSGSKIERSICEEDCKRTVMCPFCTVDSVIPIPDETSIKDAVSILEQMNMKYF